MIESIEFKNFKALRETTLPLSAFTLLLGPNGSGKSSALQMLKNIAELAARSPNADGIVATQDRLPLVSVTIADPEEPIETVVQMRVRDRRFISRFQWLPDGRVCRRDQSPDEGPAETQALALNWLSRMQVFALDPVAIARPVAVNASPLNTNGFGLAAVLDDLRDDKDRWEALIAEMREWLPEYENIEFDKPQPGEKAIALKTRNGRHRIPAKELSQGTLVALALLTLAYVANPPSLIALEEIDRGLHPRLLRHLQDALYRLSYPESCGETRSPIQVIATTHSPYLLDLYRDHPEEIVLAQKEGLEVKFNRLRDVEHFDDILGDSPLSEVWYSGVLGGVSVKP